MISCIKIKTIGWIWICLYQLSTNVWAAARFPGSAQPDFNKWQSDFIDGMFLKQSKLIWDHSEWCKHVFDCMDANSKIVKHQMCQYAWSEAKPSLCARYKDFAFENTDFNRMEFLKAHNEFREIAGSVGLFNGFSASNLRRMKWDYSLEDMAANWAAQCLPGKDKGCRRVQGSDYVGMSVELKEFTTNHTSSITAVMKEWGNSVYRLSEVGEPAQDLLYNYEDGPWHRGTQMLWHSTYKLGCASATYHEPPAKWYRIVVCYYAPPGNNPLVRVYTEGAPGDCIQGSEARLGCAGWVYPSLCATPDDTIDGSIPERKTTREKPPMFQDPHSLSIYVNPTLTNPPETTQTPPGGQPRLVREGRKHPHSMVNTETKDGNGSNCITGIAMMIATFVLLIRVC